MGNSNEPLNMSREDSVAIATEEMTDQRNNLFGCYRTSKDADVGCGRYRLVLGMLGFIIFLTQYTHRASMSIAIVSMVNHTYLRSANHELSELIPEHGTPHLAPMSNEVRGYSSGGRTDAEGGQPGTSLSVAPGPDRHARQSQVHDNRWPMARNGTVVGLVVGHELNNTRVVNSSFHNNSDLVKVVECQKDFMQQSTLGTEGPFFWSKPQQGFVLGAFNYGYAAAQLPGAMLSSRFGGKIIVTLSILIGGLVSLLIPLLAPISYIFVIFLRAIIGCTVGATYPAFFTIYSKWVPPAERTIMCGFLYAGGGLGLVIVNPIAAFFCHNHSDGWAFVFYTFGALTLITLPFWVLLVTDSPDTNTFITLRERHYIKEELSDQLVQAQTEIPPVPWLSIATSVPIWAIVIAMCTTDWGYTIYLAYIPSYMHDVLQFDLQKNGLLSALPFIAHFIALMMFPLLVDKIISSKVISSQKTRKFAQIVGALGAAVCVLGLSFMNCRQAQAAVFALTAGVMLCACVYSGFPVNVIDIAPIYAGTILGVTNTISALVGGICTPIVAILTKNHTHEEWQHVFFLTSGIYTVGTVLYCLLGSTKLQPWAHLPQSQSTCKEQPPIYSSHGDILPEVKVLMDTPCEEVSDSASGGTSSHQEDDERQHLTTETNTVT